MEEFNESYNRLTEITNSYFSDFYQSSANDNQAVFEDINHQIRTKLQIKKTLEEQAQAFEQGFKEAAEEEEARFLSTVREQVEALKTKSSILTTYIDAMSSDDFLIIKLKKDVDKHITEVYSTLKTHTEKAHCIIGDLIRMKNLLRECNELKHRTSSLMAPCG